jgi:hypothetical protein
MSPLFKRGADGIFRHCIPEEEVESVLTHCHASPYGGHASTSKMAYKILQEGLYWPNIFKDVHVFVRSVTSVSARETFPKGMKFRSRTS